MRWHSDLPQPHSCIDISVYITNKNQQPTRTPAQVKDPTSSDVPRQRCLKTTPLFGATTGPVVGKDLASLVRDLAFFLQDRHLL